MAYSVSQDFKDKIKDGAARKSCLVLFDDLFFSTSDFTDNGVTFDQYFNTSLDLTFGDCPSDTMSFSVISHGGLKAYGFGEAKAYLGVETDSQPFTMPTGYNGYIDVNGTVYSAREDGFYEDSTKLLDDPFYSVVSDGEFVYAHGASGSYKIEIGENTPEKIFLSIFMQRKLANGLSAVFASNTATVWTDTEVITIEYVPMGVYNVEKPRSTIGQIVTIEDAFDRMKLFDKDASAFLSGLTYPITIGGIYEALCTYIGVPYVSSTFTYSSTSYNASPFPGTAVTCRDVLSWIAERARSVAHFNRVGALDLVWCGSVNAEQLTPDQVQADGFTVAEYLTDAVDSVLLKSTVGTSLSFGTTFDNPYGIYGNPFIATISSADLDAYKAIPTYVPVTLNVFDADPSIDIGDLIGTLGVAKKYVAFADAMGVALTDRYGVVFAEEADGEFSFPLMNRTLRFVSAIFAEYSATGNRYRTVDAENTQYNALISPVTQEEVFNRLTNGGVEQGIYMYDGKLYINGEYIEADSITADKLDITDLFAIGATIGGFAISNNTIYVTGEVANTPPYGMLYFDFTMSSNLSGPGLYNEPVLKLRVYNNVVGANAFDSTYLLVTGNGITSRKFTTDGGGIDFNAAPNADGSQGSLIANINPVAANGAIKLGANTLLDASGVSVYGGEFLLSSAYLFRNLGISETIPDFTIPSSGYYSITSYIPAGLPAGRTIRFAQVDTWTSNTGGFNILPISNGNVYVVGEPGTVIRGLKVIFWYA